MLTNIDIVYFFQARADQADEEENDDEDMGVAETYSDYMPPKCKI